MEPNFLPKIKSRPSSRRATANTKDDKEFDFLIKTTDTGVELLTVDKELNPAKPNSRYFTGDIANLLRAMESIESHQLFNISWGEKNPGIKLDEYPYLLYPLSHCHNLVSATGQQLKSSDAKATVCISITEKPEYHAIIPTWKIILPTGETVDKFTFITENYILVDDTIYPIDDIGENYKQYTYFISPLTEGMMERYLSVVFSYFDNIKVEYNNYTTVHSPDIIDTLPVVIFEKIDSDLALHVRISQSLHGIDEEFLKRFDLSAVVHISPDKKIIVKHVRRRNIKDDIDAFSNLIKNAIGARQAKQVFNDDDYFILQNEEASPFLIKAFPQLLNEYIILGAEKLKEYKVKPVKPKLRMSLNSGIDYLEGDATVQLDNDEITLRDLFEQYRQNKYVTLSDGNRAIIDESYMRRLHRIFGDKKNAGKNVQLSYFDIPDIEDLLINKIDPSHFTKQRKFFEGYNELSKQSLYTPHLNAHLRKYQEEGVKWMKYLYDNKMGGCLADDMGLGKTVQTIAVLSEIYPEEKKPSLIVMPRTLLFNWQQELERFCPTLSVYQYYGANRSLDEAMKHQIILSTYAMLRNDIEELRKKHFHYVILDESQNIKNLAAQVTRAAFMLKADHKLALSGTPIENNLSELFSLFHFLNPGMLGDIDEFNRRYTVPIQKDEDKEATLSLRRRINPFMLRRLKNDVLTELPDRMDQTLFVEMDDPHADFYEQRRRYYLDRVNTAIATEGIQKSQFVMFQALTELRRIASVPESISDGKITSPKLDILIDEIIQAAANGHKCVVFFNYIAGIELVGERLTENGIGYQIMTGATGNRESVIKQFNGDPECKVLLMTLKTGGVGLNLTVADTVFIFEPWWNKAAEEQAINRLHRFGQKAKVQSYSIITRKTIEEKILQLQKQKAQLFEGLIGTDGTSSKQLSQEDINYILG
ncbi:MAG: DEAD/DEAH box helicase [Duncaniella sp.]|nr:DEAD/DEAH box helicase [Muribaculum sp.]MCM1255088.1 DEAD/DEAH box helicase [Duncaniella sp.]